MIFTLHVFAGVWLGFLNSFQAKHDLSGKFFGRQHQHSEDGGRLSFKRHMIPLPCRNPAIRVKAIEGHYKSL